MFSLHVQISYNLRHIQHIIHVTPGHISHPSGLARTGELLPNTVEQLANFSFQLFHISQSPVTVHTFKSFRRVFELLAR